MVAPPPIDPTHAVVQQGANTGINGHAPAVNIQWFDNGVDTPGIVLIKVKAKRATYWAGRDEGEVEL